MGSNNFEYDGCLMEAHISYVMFFEQDKVTNARTNLAFVLSNSLVHLVEKCEFLWIFKEETRVRHFLYLSKMSTSKSVNPYHYLFFQNVTGICVHLCLGKPGSLVHLSTEHIRQMDTKTAVSTELPELQNHII